MQTDTTTTEPTVSIEGLDKAAVLAALYNASQPLGMGWLHFDPKPMTRDEAQRIIDERGDDATAMFGREALSRKDMLYFDYLNGRVMKVDLSGDVLRTWLYNRDNGDGAAERVIEQLRASQ